MGFETKNIFELLAGIRSRVRAAGLKEINEFRAHSERFSEAMKIVTRRIFGADRESGKFISFSHRYLLPVPVAFDAAEVMTYTSFDKEGLLSSIVYPSRNRSFKYSVHTLPQVIETGRDRITTEVVMLRHGLLKSAIPSQLVQNRIIRERPPWLGETARSGMPPIYIACGEVGLFPIPISGRFTHDERLTGLYASGAELAGVTLKHPPFAKSMQLDPKRSIFLMMSNRDGHIHESKQFAATLHKAGYKGTVYTPGDRINILQWSDTGDLIMNIEFRGAAGHPIIEFRPPGAGLPDRHGPL